MISGFLKTKSKEKHTKLTVVNWYSTPIDTFNEIQTLHCKIRKIANSNIVIENIEMFSINLTIKSIHLFIFQISYTITLHSYYAT